MIEQATHDPARSLRDRLRTIPPRIVAKIDAERRRRGLAPLLEQEPGDRAATPTGPAVWIDPRSSIAPKGPPPCGGLWPATSIPRTVTRALLVCYGGTASRLSTGLSVDERIGWQAFGSADRLNAEKGWLLRLGHDTRRGPILSFVGSRLRAIDTDAGLVLEWIPDPTRPDHDEAARMIERGAGFASVGFHPVRRQRVNGVSLVMEGRLFHVAIVPKPAYPGAVAMLFRGRPAGAEELRRQLATVTAAAFRAAARG